MTYQPNYSNSKELSPKELLTIRSLIHSAAPILRNNLTDNEIDKLRTTLKNLIRKSSKPHDAHGICNAISTLQTLLLFASEIDPDKNILIAILLFPFVDEEILSPDEIGTQWGDDIKALIQGLVKVIKFSSKNNAVNQDNFRGLLVSLAEDIRVIIIMIVHNLVLMRSINHHPDQNWVRDVAFEANCLYAQLAHRLGLYKIKGELEDLSLKYTNREIYSQIAEKLNQTKRSREKYIAEFIAPVKEKLSQAGLKFDIKGRTKSISSIWAKMKKQKVDINGIYDLFAIRVIIDTPREKEKSDCWLAYSILADMYTANPSRMKDWISLPKSNGYESLHATVMGPSNKWVEVQFRTKRMDLIAEKGLAAHWRYKGVKSDSTDQWMTNIRDILETADSGPMQLMKNLKSDPYGKEVYAFTPKGDLFRLPAGATVLDFAFHIHSNVGSQCTGAIVNDRHEKINYKIANGDTVEIITSSSQTPKQDWLAIVTTSKARNKIRQSLNESKLHKATLGKELLERRAKNRKIDIDEAILMKLIKKSGYKFANDFYADLSDEKIDAHKFLAQYTTATSGYDHDNDHISAEEFRIIDNSADNTSSQEILVIGDKSIKGLSYKFAKCCNPINGDPVFGFISSDGTVKIHRNDCPNANNIRNRYPYRIINVNWNSNISGQRPVTLHIVGNDDIGIVTNITSIIVKEKDMILRNISIDSNDGIFQGYLVIGVSDTRRLNLLIKKIETVKGVKKVTRG
ncbi:MAG: HD domain-containing protein [Prevotella sp.]|nr:HD domain-containing protein [Bacteroides sp.]MCM1366141.1 HD domain-containing protein [Prevotella sp.]MCM1436794.1 HD domain-containing protein [Prevotella sp.]